MFRSVEMYTTRENIKSLMKGIFSTKFQAPFLTVDLEHRLADNEVRDEDGDIYFFPTLANKGKNV